MDRDRYNNSGRGNYSYDDYDSALRQYRSESAARSGHTGNIAAGRSQWQPDKKKMGVRIAAGSVILIIMLAVNIGLIMYSNMMNKVTMIDTDDVESSRVTGSDLEDLNNEFAEPELTQTDVVVTQTDEEIGLPTDFVKSTDDVSLILLIGSDSRLGIGKRARSDSIMILAIDRKHQKLKIASLMRDMYCIIPGYKNHRINQPFYYDSAYNNLDLKITFKTIQKNLGISMDKYVVVDFSGFKKVVDKLGGLNMTLTAEEAKYMCSDKHYGRFPRFSAGAGDYTLTGAEALNYARMRHVSGDDFGRTERQRKTLMQIANQLKDSSLSDIYNTVSACMECVSTNMSTSEINGYVMESLDLLKYEMVQYRVPVDGTFAYKTVYYSAGKSTTPMSIIWPNYTWNSKQLKRFIFDDDMTYANSKKRGSASIPSLPVGTIISADGQVVGGESTTASTSESTTASVTESTTKSTKSTESTTKSTESTTKSTKSTESTTKSTTESTTKSTTESTTKKTTASQPEGGEGGGEQ